MDPRKQDCFAQYLYGAGWFSRDDNTLSLLRGESGATPHFCLGCHARTDCEAHQRARVRSEQPEQVEEFDRAVKEAGDHGITYLLVEAALAPKGLNPFYNDAIESFKRGHADRGAVAGTLTQSKGADPDDR
jgi:hypothetical protein